VAVVELLVVMAVQAFFLWEVRLVVLVVVVVLAAADGEDLVVVV
jgi:hypothetical protein